MVRSAIYRNVLAEVVAREQELSLSDSSMIEQSAEMIPLLQKKLENAKEQIRSAGFADPMEETEFFREVKPQLLGKLIYYNEVYRIEITCPVHSGKLYRKYYSGQLKLLKQNNANMLDMDFYRYYRSGRTDRDHELFQRGHPHFPTVLNSFFFEMDSEYSTYYDHLAARFVAQDLLYAHILSRLDPNAPSHFGNYDIPDDLKWTGTKTALIELIYALYISGVISDGKIGIRKVSTIFQLIFKIPLGDIHHAFHRMKDRAGKRNRFIEQLRDSLEDYMNKSL